MLNPKLTMWLESTSDGYAYFSFQSFLPPPELLAVLPLWVGGAVGGGCWAEVDSMQEQLELDGGAAVLATGNRPHVAGGPPNLAGRSPKLHTLENVFHHNAHNGIAT
jgi:hypothetical protein